MGGLLILISVVTGTVAFISLIRPLPRFWLPTRKRATVVWVASFVLLFIGAGLSPNPTPEELAAQKARNQERPDITDLREKAKEGDANALLTMGDAYHFGEGGMPKSASIAMQYYAKAYEKAIEQGDLKIRRNAASGLSSLYFSEGNDAEAEKWQKRHTEAIKKIAELEKAERQKLIDEHEAMIPQ